jgi:hypothetical protein
MKARKTLKHQELCVPLPVSPPPSDELSDSPSRSRSVMEVIKQIGQRFKVEPAEIKKVRNRFARSAVRQSR